MVLAVSHREYGELLKGPLFEMVKKGFGGGRCEVDD